jgi:hypothetical protein
MALLILMVSTVGAAMVYYLARQWFADRRTALLAATLYLFMPARIFFLPVMNVVTPLLLLLPMCLIEVFAASRRLSALVAAGAAIYLLVLFEPLPLAAGPVIAGQVLLRVGSGRFAWRDAGWLAALVGAGALVMHLLFVWWFGFDVVTAFVAALADARAFNAATGRPYGLWLAHDVKDFLIHMGVGQSALILFALVSPRLGGVGGQWLRWTLAGVLVTLALLGVNRGEIVRLWIFLGVLWQIAAAPIITAHPRTFRIVLTLAIAHAALLSASVRWLEP